MFIRAYDKTIINIDNMADITLNIKEFSITSRSPKAVNHNYDIFKLNCRVSDTTNGMGDEYYIIYNPLYIEYYQAVLFSTLGETQYELDLENGIIKIPNKDINGEYQRNIGTNEQGGNQVEYRYPNEYKIPFDENGEPMVSVSNPEDYYVLVPTTVTVTQKDEGLYVLTPTFITHIINASVIQEFVNDVYDKINQAIFENTSIDIYGLMNEWYKSLYEIETMEVYKPNKEPIPATYLLVNNKGYAVLENNSYIYVQYKGDPVIDPETGEQEIDDQGNPIYEVIPLRVGTVEYAKSEEPEPTPDNPEPTP